jgi:hypothetical protein
MLLVAHVLFARCLGARITLCGRLHSTVQQSIVVVERWTSSTPTVAIRDKGKITMRLLPAFLRTEANAVIYTPFTHIIGNLFVRVHFCWTFWERPHHSERPVEVSCARLGIRGLFRRLTVTSTFGLLLGGLAAAVCVFTMDWDASLSLNIVVGGGSGDAAKKSIAPKTKLNKYDMRRA